MATINFFYISIEIANHIVPSCTEINVVLSSPLPAVTYIRKVVVIVRYQKSEACLEYWVTKLYTIIG